MQSITYHTFSQHNQLSAHLLQGEYKCNLYLLHCMNNVELPSHVLPQPPKQMIHELKNQLHQCQECRQKKSTLKKTHKHFKIMANLGHSCGSSRQAT